MRRLRIAVDVGSRAVKVAWITIPRRGSPEWDNALRPRSPADPPEQVALVLRDLLRALHVNCYDVSVVLAVAQSHVRQVTLSVSDLKQLPASIQGQVPTLFPFEPGRCQYDFRLVNQQPVNGHLACSVQVAGCDLEVLRLDLEACWRIGWIPSQATPSALALVALAEAQGQLGAESVLLLELGAKYSILALVVNRQVVFARATSLGSDYLTEALMSEVMVGQERLQLSWEQAERLKCRVGIPERRDDTALPLKGELPLTMYQAMLQPVLEQWRDEIRRTIAFGLHLSEASQGAAQAESMPETAPQKVLLCGGGSQLIGLDRWLTQHLDLPVQRLSVQSILGEELPAFAAVCGLLVTGGTSGRVPASRPALLPVGAPSRAQQRRRAAVNLLPEQTRQARRLIRSERTTIKGLIIAGISLWLGIGALTLQRVLLARRLIPLEQRWQQLEPIRTLAQTVTTQTALLNTLTSARGVPVEWFKTLARGFPSPVRLTTLEVSAEGAVRVVGQAQAREQTPEAYVSELVMWLEQMRVCQEVRLGSTERSHEESELVDFNLTCRRL